MVLTVFPTFWLPPLPYAFSSFLKAISGIALILQLLAWINVTYFWKISGLLAIEFNMSLVTLIQFDISISEN